MKDYSKKEKLAIIAESESESTTKAATCRKYGIAKNTLLYWRKTILEDSDEQDKLMKQTLQAFEENIRLKSIIIDKELEIQVLKELLKKGDQRRKTGKK